MKSILSFITLIAASAFFLSCNKGGNERTCPAGAGGNINLVATPKHHSKSVKPYSIWVAYDTHDVPGISVSDYDLNQTADSTQTSVRVTGLKCGNYYIFMKGFDTAINAGVVGGIPVTIPENATGDFAIDVPVTE